METTTMGLGFRAYIGVICLKEVQGVILGLQRLYWDNGKENGNYRDYRGYKGIIGVILGLCRG